MVQRHVRLEPGAARTLFRGLLERGSSRGCPECAGPLLDRSRSASSSGKRKTIAAKGSRKASRARVPCLCICIQSPMLSLPSRAARPLAARSSARWLATAAAALRCKVRRLRRCTRLYCSGSERRRICAGSARQSGATPHLLIHRKHSSVSHVSQSSRRHVEQSCCMQRRRHTLAAGSRSIYLALHGHCSRLDALIKKCSRKCI